MQRKALGRGLEAIIPKTKNLTESSGFCQVPIEEVFPGKMQPRKNFDEKSLQELALSIKEKGILQPPIVQSKNGGYELIAGERRWRAAQVAGLSEIPVIVKDLSGPEVLEVALIENIQREDLNPIEEAQVYKRLIDDFNLTQENLSKRVGKDRSSVANCLRLLKLPELVKQDLINGTLSMGHARALLSLNFSEKIIEVRNSVVKKGLSVREIEALINRINNLKSRPLRKTKNIFLENLENKIQKSLGTRVKIKTSGKKGKIEISYFSNDDLNRIVKILS